MKIKYGIFVLAVSCLCSVVHAQELNAKVTVLSKQVSTTTDKKIFTTLQTALTNLLNNRNGRQTITSPTSVSNAVFC